MRSLSNSWEKGNGRMSSGKVCSRCNRDLPPNKFGVSSRNSDGLQSWCKECYQDYYREHKDPEGERYKPEPRSPGNLLGSFGSGVLLLFSIFFRENENELSQLFEAELLKRVRRESNRESHPLQYLWRSASYVNEDIVPELIKIRFIAEELLNRSGVDPLIINIDTQMYKLWSFIESEGEDTAK